MYENMISIDRQAAAPAGTVLLGHLLLLLPRRPAWHALLAPTPPDPEPLRATAHARSVGPAPSQPMAVGAPHVLLARMERMCPTSQTDVRPAARASTPTQAAGRRAHDVPGGSGCVT